ncbi:hypothetical protein M408DRAFT_98060 [Serendipita vermifera MAFF 305830]|uniref:Uncharacterized protein n=1 Tax=Serendipita vermifera MAFF 305830 TaxID=933852 RepID=A0A0C3BT75_SERVB|nr:hypothetical protein M408DRAFT_98060 [Serendipita vermifera MAFF 305830]
MTRSSLPILVNFRFVTNPFVSQVSSDQYSRVVCVQCQLIALFRLPVRFLFLLSVMSCPQGGLHSQDEPYGGGPTCAECFFQGGSHASNCTFTIIAQEAQQDLQNLKKSAQSQQAATLANRSPQPSAGPRQ